MYTGCLVLTDPRKYLNKLYVIGKSVSNERDISRRSQNPRLDGRGVFSSFVLFKSNRVHAFLYAIRCDLRLSAKRCRRIWRPYLFRSKS